MSRLPEHIRRELELACLWAELDRLSGIVKNPGPLTVRGKVMTDPSTGNPAPDLAAAVDAAGKSLAVLERMWKLMQAGRAAA
jgi:hypothetical protein